jgi:hypothetical protein
MKKLVTTSKHCKNTKIYMKIYTDKEIQILTAFFWKITQALAHKKTVTDF